MEKLFCHKVKETKMKDKSFEYRFSLVKKKLAIYELQAKLLDIAKNIILIKQNKNITTAEMIVNAVSMDMIRIQIYLLKSQHIPKINFKNGGVLNSTREPISHNFK